MALAVSASQRSDRQAFAPAFAGFSPPQKKRDNCASWAGPVDGWDGHGQQIPTLSSRELGGLRRVTTLTKMAKKSLKQTRGPSTAEKRQPLTLRQIGGRVRCRNNLATHRPMSRLIHHGCFLDGRDLDGTRGLDAAASRWSAWRPLHHVRGSFDGEPPQG